MLSGIGVSLYLRWPISSNRGLLCRSLRSMTYHAALVEVNLELWRVPQCYGRSNSGRGFSNPCAISEATIDKRQGQVEASDFEARTSSVFDTARQAARLDSGTPGWIWNSFFLAAFAPSLLDLVLDRHQELIERAACYIDAI